MKTINNKGVFMKTINMLFNRLINLFKKKETITVYKQFNGTFFAKEISREEFNNSTIIRRHMSNVEQKPAAVNAGENTTARKVASVLNYLYAVLSAVMVIIFVDKLTAQSNWMEYLRIAALFSCVTVGLVGAYLFSRREQ